MGWKTLHWVALLPLLLLSSAGSGGFKQGADPQSIRPGGTEMSDVAQLGKLIFQDESLSASGQMACQTCHVPEHAHAAPSADLVSPGGAHLDRRGLRNSPSIRYAHLTPSFHFEPDGTPVGGFFRDGRAMSLMDQAHGPFLDANEMANSSTQSIVDKLQAASYVSEFKRLFGADILDNPQRAFDSVASALAQYQTEDKTLHPFDSKYDAISRRQDHADRAGIARPETVRRSTEGKLRGLPPECHGRRWIAAAFHRFHV
jgi:cytochrome c peroxidase